MNIRQNVSLRDYSTMRLGGRAAYLADITSVAELEEAVAWADERKLPIIMMGSGSNIIWRDEGFAGLVMVAMLTGFEAQQEDDENVYLTIGAGEPWDDVVGRTVEMGLSGVEALSLIPGTAGATPVQNVGAYGQEIADTLISVTAYDQKQKQMVTIPNDECGFGYRTSRFKTTDHGRFFITAITLRLLKRNPTPPFYAAVQQYFTDHAIQKPTPAAVREAVVAIRTSKLPDPRRVANNGSFFANPVIRTDRLAELEAQHGHVPHWPVDKEHVKVAAAWLLEQAGFKNFHDSDTGMGTWPAQPLVLVNEHAKTTAQLLTFRQKVLDAVKQKFDIGLEQEPEILP